MPSTDDVMQAANKMGQTLAQETDKHLIRMRQSIKRLQQRITNQLKDLTTGKDGKLMGPRVNLKQAQKVHQQLINAFDEEYGEVLRKGLDKSFKAIADQIQNTFRDLDIAMEFTGVDRDMIAALKTQALKEFEAYGQQAMDQMATAMYDTVVARGTFAELVATLDGILIGGVDARGQSMAQYSALWANDALMNFQQRIHLKKGRDAGLDHYLYFGNVIERSRPFCIDRAGKIFSEEQIKSWDAMSWQGKSGPALTNRGGWNCRHHWQPVDPSWLPEEGLDIGDYFDETGTQPGVARGSTMPVWPGPGAKGAKPLPPKPPPRKPIVFGDPATRWVPPDGFHSDANAWSEAMYKAGQDYHKWSGLNPSGPIADNIVEALEAQGRNGRVMQTTFRNVLGGAKGEQDKLFTHFVAVELDDTGRVIRVFDVGNEYLVRAELRTITDLMPGGQLPEYWPTLADDIDLKRMSPTIFKKGQWARDTSSLYSMDDHMFFYDKMMDPAVLREAERMARIAAAEAAKQAAEEAAKKAAKEVVEAPGTKTPQVGMQPWKAAKTKAEAQRQLMDIIEECKRRDTYVTVRWGNDIGAHYVRFRHDPTHWSWKDRYKPHRWKAAKLHAEIKVSSKTTLEQLNAINRKLHEFQARLSLYELPPLRGAFTWAGKADWAANMGDGVMGLHHDAFSSWFDDLVFDRVKYANNLNRAVEQQRALLKTIADLEGTKSTAYKAIKEQMDLRLAELKKLDEDIWEGPLYGNHKGTATKWRPGDDTVDRPENVRDYFNNYADRGYKTMEHELGHHIHQQMFVDGATDLYDDPPFEKWLDYVFNGPQRQNITRMAPSRYALKNSHEWFAENYCSWQMGMKHLVNEELVGVLEGLDDLAAGRISYRDFKYMMFDGGDFARPLLVKARRVYKEAAEMADKVDELYYQVLNALKKQEGRVSAFDLHDVLSKEWDTIVWTSDVEKALEKALKAELVSKTPQGWMWGTKKLGTLPSKYMLPPNLSVPPAPNFQKAVLEMWDTMVHRSLMAETTTMQQLMDTLGVDAHVAKIFINDIKKQGLATQIGAFVEGHEAAITNTTEFFIKDPNQFVR
jgi:hypothetical protein